MHNFTQTTRNTTTPAGGVLQGLHNVDNERKRAGPDPEGLGAAGRDPADGQDRR